MLRTALAQSGNIGIAYTYNEPTVWYEFMMDVSKLSVQHGLKNVMVTNGFIAPEPLEELLATMHAFNVDLKAFTESFYKNQAGAALEPVKRTLKHIRSAERHLEITNLVIPGLNDDPGTFEEMIRWIAGELGSSTVLHLSKYHPDYKSRISETPVSTLLNLFVIAKKHLDYVYLGNVNVGTKGNDTVCAGCGSVLVERTGYNTGIRALNQDGKCSRCGKESGIIMN